MIRRRFAATALAVVLASPSVVVHAQIYRLGVLWPGTQREAPTLAFLAQLKLLGYEQGKNLAIESLSAEWDAARFPQMARELVRKKPDVIFAPTAGAATAAKAATHAIPVVFAIVPDPVEAGLVATLARPGGNLTGTTNVQTGLTLKRFQILREALPAVQRVAIIYDPMDKVAVAQLDEARKAAGELKLQLTAHEAAKLGEFQAAFAALTKERTQAAFIAGSLASYSLAKPIAELAIKHRIPTMNADRKYVEEGALMAYGVDFPALFAKAANYVDRIFKGAKPGDLPVEQADKFEMLINMKTAKALGLNLPQTVLVRADRVIE